MDRTLFPTNGTTMCPINGDQNFTKSLYTGIIYRLNSLDIDTHSYITENDITRSNFFLFNCTDYIPV